MTQNVQKPLKFGIKKGGALIGGDALSEDFTVSRPSLEVGSKNLGKKFNFNFFSIYPKRKVDPPREVNFFQNFTILSYANAIISVSLNLSV